VEKAKTDEWAARAINFSNAYTAVPLSNPSRAAFLTGIQPFVTGIYNNQHSIEYHPVANNSVFMPQHFKDNGYKTLAAGKVFHTKPSSDVINKMWDDQTFIDGGYGPWITNSVLPAGLDHRWRNFEPKTGPETDFPDVRNSQKVIDFLQVQHDKPFFAAMGFYRPHNPYTAPKKYFDMYKLEDIQRPNIPADDLDDVPAYAINNFVNLREYTRLLRETGNYYEQMIRAYMACVTFADDRIGMILDALYKSAYANNTWIVLIGDNGFHLGEKEHWTKTTLWRKANHVPFLVVPPKSNTTYTAAECKTPVSLIDIYPTLIDICGLTPLENQLQGNNLKALMQNPQAAWDKPSISTFLPGNFTVHHHEIIQ
jgi:arylsulfatase A-like enzyme